MIDELNLDDFFNTLKKDRDSRLVTLLRATAAHNLEAIRGVLEVLSDQYPKEVEEILGEFSDDDDEEEDHAKDQEHDPFEDEDLYESETLFGDYEMGHEHDLDIHMEILLQNPEAINSLLILIAQNPDLDLHLLELLENPDFDLGLEEDESPSPRPKRK